MDCENHVDNSLLSFSNNLYTLFCQKEGAYEKNLFLSPFSIYSAFILLLAGSKSATWNELHSALVLPKAEEKALFELIKTSLTSNMFSTDKVTLSSANAAFSEETYQIQTDYIDCLQKYFAAEHQKLPFIKDSTGSVKNINDWIAKKTNDKIVNCLPESAINALTRLILVNAIYFKGSWVQKFDKASTTTGTFHCLNNEEKEMQFMHRTGKYEYKCFSDLEASAVIFPFIDEPNREIRMLVILPDQVDGLPNVIKKLLQIDEATGQSKFNYVLKTQFYSRDVEVSMPRFKLGGEDLLDLKPIMQSMGVTSAFNESSANLSGISSQNDLFVSGAHHMALLEVNEEGAEAAAATVIRIQVRSMPPPPVKFQVDRPFIVALLSGVPPATVIPLFIGHCVEPKELVN